MNMAKFFVFPLLVVGVSIVESYTIHPYPASRLAYGYPNARVPLSAGFRQSSLGPFFGYFPDMFGTRCPTCDAPPKTKAITTCLTDGTAVSDMSDSPSGTIKIDNLTASNQVCGYAIMTTPSYKSIKINCKTITNEMELSPLAVDTTASTTLKTGTDYTVTGGRVYVKFTASAAPASETIDCTWTAMP